MVTFLEPRTSAEKASMKRYLDAFWAEQIALRQAEKDWDESLHPRDEQGRFTESGVGGEPWTAENLTVTRTGAATTGPRSPALVESLRHAEANLAELPNNRAEEDSAHEEIYVLDKDGKFLYEGKGEAHTADVPADKRDLLRGAVVTHNHPGYHLSPAFPGDKGEFYQASGVSDQDVMFAAHAGVAEVRAVTERFIYSLRPAEGQEWPEFKGLHSLLRSVEERVKATNWGLIGEGKRSIYGASVEHGNQKLRILSDEIGVRYEVISR